MQIIINSFDGLKKHIAELEGKFINQYIPVDPEIGPEEYEHFVKAYCLLSHAAIEDYIEEVALKVMKRSIDDWMHQKKLVNSLFTLIACYGIPLKIDEGEDETKIFDYLRKILGNANDKMSNDVEKNHGISITNLRKLLIPVGIDIKQDIKLKESLKKLSSERGVYAHYQKGDRKGAKKVLSPEDAKICVEDCLKLCEDIQNKAVKIFNGT